ncbi:polysaccharide deacetylase family protein [Algibacter mikhailovii]|uniref:NodB homology domain-containing protein n=1 Tax=Algibacter mikhailovii TaxID=425498 RepID=A0A918VFY4_9FLAO|nr:polysaccharide deacetylase family protein [Algibacter mikhailovii]GGZ93631.1 hypothetical protein GCM10007028_35060 [Algibacter mikhailovii]
MIKSILKKTFLFFRGDILLKKTNKTPRVIFWHGVDNNPDPLIEAESIDKKAFIKQLNYLEKNYSIIGIDDFHLRYKNNKFIGDEILLTFDDGYRNNLTVLAPILKERNIPYTVFISTKNISEGKLFPTSILRLVIYGSSITNVSIPFLNINLSINKSDDEKKKTYAIINEFIKESSLKDVEIICSQLINNIPENEWDMLVNKYNSVKPLTWDEIREIQKTGCTIGSHCIDHICCHDNQNKEEVKNQIVESKKTIEKELQIDCNYFAFPNGDYTDYAKECVRDAGYKMGFSTKRVRFNYQDNEQLAIPRFSMPFNFDTFKITLNLYPKN